MEKAVANPTKWHHPVESVAYTPCLFLASAQLPALLCVQKHRDSTTTMDATSVFEIQILLLMVL
jgi:hypothetical protein